MIKLQFRYQPEQFVGMTTGSITIGRDVSNDLTIDQPTVSDFHAEIVKTERGLEVVDLLSATGTFVNDERIGSRCELKAWDVLRFGVVELEVNDPAVHRPRDWALRGQSGLLASQYLTVHSEMVIGRDSDCDLTINDDSLSRRHAQITIENGQLRVRDLGSANGSFVNGVKIVDEILQPGDEIQFGVRAFIVVAPVDVANAGSREDVTKVQDSDGNATASELDVETEVLAGSYPSAVLTELTGLLGADYCCTLDRRSMCLGRSPNSDIVIADASVSRVHAQLSVVGNRWQIEDMQSSNGILINGESAESMKLHNGDLIRIGRAEFRFQCGAD